MKKLLIIGIVSLLSATMAMAEQVVVQTKNITLVLDVNNGKQPTYVYFGSKLNANELGHLQYPTNGRMEVYPAHGLNTPAEDALAMRHIDGNMSTALVATGVENTEEAHATVTTIHTKDVVYPINVDIKYRAYKDVDMIETWTEITNNEKGTVTLTTFASACLPIRRGEVWLSHLWGSWANEGRLTEELLEPGQKIIKNKDGTRNSHTDHAEVMFSLDGKARENSGDVIGAALCYSG
ncbi:MAG: alpha-galactosidase, partial [Prevotella sp.]|nr:alpha-galactosidase [Prevotella sp.]